jgi:HSP20 family molecular chaperone IbpA
VLAVDGMSEDVSTQSIPVKMYRTDRLVTVTAPMPGLDADHLAVEVTAEGTLVLRGHLRGMLGDAKELLVDEWSVGPYYREVALPAPVDGPGTTVTYGNGVLVVALPVVDGAPRPASLTLERTGPTRAMHTPSSPA